MIDQASSEAVQSIKPVILVIDDHAPIRELLHKALEQWYDVRLAANGQQGLRLASELYPELIILDIILPDVTGLEVCRRLRTWYTGPILVVSVQEYDTDKAAALDQGADDYLAKPFSIKEMHARIHALLRRIPPVKKIPSAIASGKLHIDLPGQCIWRACEQITLTPTEAEILACLLRQAGQVVAVRTLLEQVWGSEYCEDIHTLRVHINRLRKKLEPDPEAPRFLCTVSGIGYRLNIDAAL